MPMVVKEAGSTAEAVAESLAPENFEATLEMVSRSCTLQPPYTKIKVPAVPITGQITVCASPDSMFAVTKRFLDAAEKSIRIGIYDFSAAYMANLLKDSIARRVKVTLMLDTDHVKGEDEIFKDLERSGATCVSAPSCASANPSAHVFRSSHEKYVVIDDEMCFVQSGNYSINSIPMNVLDGKADGHFRTGNRDMAVVVRSRELAKFLTRVLNSDIDLELSTPEAVEAAARALPPAPMLVEAAPSKRPDKLFPSKTFNLSKPLSVQPVMSPDNYMEIMPAALRAATDSILIEQQYIHSEDEPVADLLQAIADARGDNPSLDVRIVLGKIFSNKDLAKEKKNLANMAHKYDLRIGRNIRYIDTTRLVHCHNKLVIVDGQNVLVSSQNWSRAAILDNREAGLFFKHPGVASYFTDIFEVDWKTAQKKLPSRIGPQVASPESLKKGGFIEVAAADYQQL